jgi:hypothetical protein
MYQLAGEWLPFVEPDELSIADRIAMAKAELVEETGQDFGFDIRKWHEYLIASDDSYRWSNKHLSILKRIEEAENDSGWQKAISTLRTQESAT